MSDCSSFTMVSDLDSVSLDQSMDSISVASSKDNGCSVLDGVSSEISAKGVEVIPVSITSVSESGHFETEIW